MGPCEVYRYRRAFIQIDHRHDYVDLPDGSYEVCDPVSGRYYIRVAEGEARRVGTDAIDHR